MARAGSNACAQADFVWRHLDLPPAEVSLVLADSTFIATLNETYRNKKGATNVLSFPAQDFTAPVTRNAALNNMPLPRLLGDIVLAHDVLAAEAQAQGKDKQDHMLHLLTHGLLHLLGHDHVKMATRSDGGIGKKYSGLAARKDALCH